MYVPANRISWRLNETWDCARCWTFQGITFQRSNEKFALELEKRLSQEKDRDNSRDEEGKIVIHQEGDQKDGEAKNENKNYGKDNPQDMSLIPDEFKSNKINLLA